MEKYDSSCYNDMKEFNGLEREVKSSRLLFAYVFHIRKEHFYIQDVTIDFFIPLFLYYKGSYSLQ